MTLTRRRPCAAPPPPAEPDMFGPVKQPRVASKEPERVHDDVLTLRRDGATVLRQGRHTHMVDGTRVDDRQLAQLAADARRRHAAVEQASAPVTPPIPAPVVAEAVIKIAAPNPRHATTQEIWDALEIPEWARPDPAHVPFWRRPKDDADVSQRAEGAGQP